jgi:hypothetical protein
VRVGGVPRWSVGLAALALAAAPATAGAKPRELLPNLVALPSGSLYVGGPSTYYLDARNGGAVWGCHASEVANDTPTPARCLRFATSVANLGTGPLEVRYRADEIATTRGVVQRVYRADGTYQDSGAGTYVADPAHAHFHYTDFAVAALWRSDARGRRLGATALRTGRKAGFCLQDVYQYRDGVDRTYTGTESCYPTAVAADGSVAQVNGVSAGWVDVYELALPHQYVEISGVPDGYYLLQISVDPARHLRETSTRDNVVWQRIRLCGETVDIVGRTAFCDQRRTPLFAADPPPAARAAAPGPHLAERLNFCAIRP